MKSTTLEFKRLSKPSEGVDPPMYVKLKGQDYPYLIVYDFTVYYGFFADLLNLASAFKTSEDAIRNLWINGGWNKGGFYLEKSVCCGVDWEKKEVWFCKIQNGNIIPDKLAIINFF